MQKRIYQLLVCHRELRVFSDGMETWHEQQAVFESSMHCCCGVQQLEVQLTHLDVPRLHPLELRNFLIVRHRCLRRTDSARGRCRSFRPTGVWWAIGRCRSTFWSRSSTESASVAATKGSWGLAMYYCLCCCMTCCTLRVGRRLADRGSLVACKLSLQTIHYHTPDPPGGGRCCCSARAFCFEETYMFFFKFFTVGAFRASIKSNLQCAFFMLTSKLSKSDR